MTAADDPISAVLDESAPAPRPDDCEHPPQLLANYDDGFRCNKCGLDLPRIGKGHEAVVKVRDDLQRVKGAPYVR